MSAHVNPLRHAHRGTATVEFAIALPVLLLLMLATAEFGRLISQYNTLSKAVRDGARYAASTAALGSTGLVYVSPQIQASVANLVSTGNINGTGSALLPGLSASSVTVSNAGNGYVLVSATYTYVPMLGTTLPTFGLGSPISLSLTLNAASTMRVL